jgi:hypothetical protein
MILTNIYSAKEYQDFELKEEMAEINLSAILNPLNSYQRKQLEIMRRIANG